MSTIRVTVTGARQAGAYLGGLPRRARPRLTQAVEVNARKIRDTARDSIGGHPRLRAYPASISYDMATGFGFGTIAADIGPDKSKPQGALGNIIEYGTSKNAPIPHLGPALLAQTQDLQRGIERAIEQSL